MKLYTLGFIFNSTRDQVLLIHKKSPEWQIGKINGIGGKTEAGEASIDCIVREVTEETGLLIPQDNWTHAGKIHGDTWESEVYVSVYEGKLTDSYTAGLEEVEWFAVDNLPDNVIGNLKFLIPMTLDRLGTDTFQEFSIQY